MPLRRWRSLNPLLNILRLHLPLRLRVCFADPPVAGPSAPGPAEEEDDDGASVVSNPLGRG